MVSSAISDLRKFQWGMEGVRAHGAFTMATKPTAADTVTIGGIVYTFRAAWASEGDVVIGAAVINSQAALVAAINGTDTHNTPHPKVRAAAFITNVMTVTALQPGVAGNSIATIKTLTDMTDAWAAATLTTGAALQGTAVPAKEVLLINNVDIKPTDVVYHPVLQRGLIQRFKGLDIVTSKGMSFEIPDTIVTYEQLVTLGAYTVVGKVVPTGTGFGPFTWVYNRDPRADPNIDTFTLERQIKAFAGVSDSRWPYCFFSKVGWKSGKDMPIMWNGSGFGRAIDDSQPFTASLEAPDMQGALSSNTRVYFCDSWAELNALTPGVGHVEGQVITWECGLMTGYEPLKLNEGRLDFSRPAISSENTQLMAKISILWAPGEQIDTERTAAQEAALRFVRIEATGEDGRLAQWDMVLKHNLGDLYGVGSFEGQEMIEMDFVESTDDDLVSGADLFRLTVTVPDRGAVV